MLSQRKTIDFTWGTLVKIPTFNGEPKNFQIWLMRFKAFAHVNGFKFAVKRMVDADMTVSYSAVIDEKTVDGKLQLKAKKVNEVAMVNLMMPLCLEVL